MLLHELVQHGDGVQVPAGDLVPLGVQAPGPDLAVLAENELVGKAVLQHIGVIICVVIGEDYRLFPLREVERVADHLGRAVLIGGLAPHVADVHQDIALLVDVIQDLRKLAHRHHEVVQAVGLGVAVKGQLRVGDDRMEEEMLHNAVIGHVGHAVPRPALRHHLGVQNLVGLRRRGGFRLRLGFRVRGGFRLGRGLSGRGLSGGLWVRRGGGRLGAPCRQQHQRQHQHQRNGSFHHLLFPS